MLTFARFTDLYHPLLPKFERVGGAWDRVASIPGIRLWEGPRNAFSSSTIFTEYVALVPASLRISDEAIRILEVNMRTGFKPEAVIGWAIFDPRNEQARMAAFMQQPPYGLPFRRPSWKIWPAQQASQHFQSILDLLSLDRQAPFLTYVSQSTPEIQHLSPRELTSNLLTPLKK